MVDHEAMCVMRSAKGEWLLTAAYRSGRRSVMDCIADFRPADAPPVPDEFSGVCHVVTKPCVLIDMNVDKVVELASPDQVYALAQWLVAASMQLATDTEVEEF
jgi:hypothetical protein